MAGRCNAISTGLQILRVNLFDHVRSIEEYSRGPQSAAHVAALFFQLRTEPAIKDKWLSGMKLKVVHDKVVLPTPI